MKKNSTRFIAAFNQIDYSLRTQFNFKRSINFADLIRRCVNLSSVVRKFEEDLIDYGRLRNAIIHNSNDEYTIAEPHDDITIKIEKIAKILSTPPTVLNAVCKNEVISVDHDVSLKNVIKLISKTGFSNIPIYKNGGLVGVANGQKILNDLGDALIRGNDLSQFITETKIEDVVTETYTSPYYFVANERLTIEAALDMFYKNRRLLVVLITKTGDMLEVPIGIITVADIMDMNAILDNY